MSKVDFTRLKELLSYNQKTGVFTRRVAQGNKKRGDIAGCVDTRGYIRIRIDGISYGAHRLAWLYVFGEWPVNVVDHVNGDRADNRIKNLRDVSQSHNMQNVHKARKDNQTKLRGAFCVGTRYRSAITTKGKTTPLGEYKTAEEAHNAYLRAKREQHIR